LQEKHGIGPFVVHVCKTSSVAYVIRWLEGCINFIISELPVTAEAAADATNVLPIRRICGCALSAVPGEAPHFGGTAKNKFRLVF
jgi:hypothetical protein